MLNTQLIGFLGQDAVIHNVNGKQVINFSIAHSESWIDAQGNKKEKTVWVNSSYWSDKTKVAEYLKKGTQVYVEGYPEAKIYNAKDGTPTPQLTLRIKSIQLLGSKTQQSSAPQTANDITEPLENLPF